MSGGKQADIGHIPSRPSLSRAAEVSRIVRVSQFSLYVMWPLMGMMLRTDQARTFPLPHNICAYVINCSSWHLAWICSTSVLTAFKEMTSKRTGFCHKWLTRECDPELSLFCHQILIQWNLGSRMSLIMNKSVHEQIFRTKNISGDERCLE
jgi:putative component of membrane protein insertase Oxa1/YidC/SpoIIIJ protein YidD